MHDTWDMDEWKWISFMINHKIDALQILRYILEHVLTWHDRIFSVHIKQNCEKLWSNWKRYTTSHVDLSPSSKKHWNTYCWMNWNQLSLHDSRKHMQITFPLTALTSGRRSCVSPFVLEQAALQVPLVGSRDLRGDTTLLV